MESKTAISKGFDKKNFSIPTEFKLDSTLSAFHNMGIGATLVR